MEIVATRSTARRILILRKRGREIIIQEAGKIGFPTLREHIRATIEQENAAYLCAEAALAEDFRDPDFQTVGTAAKASPVLRDRGAVFIFQPSAEIGRQLDQF
jgi:hypothetical protein